ncbi:sirohydrochlorin nickelochelatase [Methanococcoides sp.]|uniref:sirohydrochlorin nickelochelatase n=1 Tax=Methanococcoides sp. TaxID=1966350 RepID=UPI00272DC85A|nr:sirohydrochlorin nickelochelatase [Methanococcoides sp.]
MENNTGVLVLGHDSSLPFNKEVVNAVADMIGKCNENTVVKTAFLNIDTPTLHEELKNFEGTGVNRIVALPCFLTPSVHTTKDIPRVLGIDEGNNRTMIQLGGADIELLYAKPLGANPCIAGIACKRIGDVLNDQTGMPDGAQLWEQGMRESIWMDDIAQQANSVNEYWDDQSPSYNRGHDAYRSPVVDRLKKYIDTTTTVLDIGTGTGALTIPLAKKVNKAKLFRKGGFEDASIFKMEGMSKISSKKREEVPLRYKLAWVTFTILYGTTSGLVNLSR